MTGLRRFLLLRHQAVSGVSGTGVVAEGAEFSDGSAALRWHGPHPSTAAFDAGAEAIVAVHGHHGATEVLYAEPVVDSTRPKSLRGDRQRCRCCGAVLSCNRCHPISPMPIDVT